MWVLTRCPVRARPSLAFISLLFTAVVANNLPSCSNEHPGPYDELCSDPLEDITVVELGQFVIAKLQCYGCPTTATFQNGDHETTHEENALVRTPFRTGSPLNSQCRLCDFNLRAHV